MKSIKKIILAACIPLTIGSLTTMAAEVKNQANWVSSAGANWRDTAGECWRSSSWTPALATEECDPNLFKKAEAPAPVVVAEAPKAAEPAPAPAPDRIENRKVAFAAEDLFAFDKSTLKPSGKAKLDDLVDKMKVTHDEVIVATGHTDRIGSPKYNQKLSERRANSVRSYLISKGISADQIRAEGKGETQPVTKRGECKGPFSKKLVACLQPDRRVEIEVTATKEVTTRAQ